MKKLVLLTSALLLLTIISCEKEEVSDQIIEQTIDKDEIQSPFDRYGDD